WAIYVCPRCMQTCKSQELEKTMTNAGVVLPQSSMPSLQSAPNMKANGSPNGDPDGSAVWLKEHGGGDDGNGLIRSKQDRPLSRKISVPAAILAPYRLLIFFRIVVLGMYLAWRIKDKNEDAIWLWGMSVICEIWFTFSWLLEQLPKLSPVKRTAELAVLIDKFETVSPQNPLGKSDLPGIDVFVTTADPDKEPLLVMANTVLSVLAADYPAEKLACYLSDDAGSLLTFETMAEVASFATVWVPFCRKHDIEPRGPESYFSLKKDPYRNKMRTDFVKDRRRMKREYDEFKVRINALFDMVRWRSDAYNACEESRALRRHRELHGDEPIERPKVPKATWMADGSHWPGTWMNSSPQHTYSNHAAIVQVMI
ncbi:hypothetical protein B296_00039322, partial [Ensete ventricosum]